MQVLEALAASRWSEPGDLIDALEQLGIRAISLTADDVDLEGRAVRLRTGRHQLDRDSSSRSATWPRPSRRGSRSSTGCS